MKPYTLDRDHRITADDLCFKLQERCEKGGPNPSGWKTLGYYQHLSEVGVGYTSRSTRRSPRTLPQGANHAIDRLHRAAHAFREAANAYEESLNRA